MPCAPPARTKSTRALARDTQRGGQRGTTRLINFAHGELVTLGATVAFMLNASVTGPQLQLIPAALVTVALGAAFGGVLELGLWKPLRRQGIGRIQLFIISIGLSLLIRHIILVLFGTRPQPYADYTIQQERQWGPVSIAARDLVISVLSLLVLVGVALMLQPPVPERRHLPSFPPL